MKTGRRGVEPTKKGEDPKKKNGVEPVKAQQDVKVTAQKRYYTQEDYDKSQAIKEANKARKAQYESDVASYNQAIKLYNEGIPANDNSESLSVLNKAGLSAKGKKASFEANKERLSAAKSNVDYEKSIKSGEYIDINDPSISEKNRYYLKGAMLGNQPGSSDALGRSTNMAVPKSMAYDKDLNWKKIYDEDFDPYEFQKAAKSGKFDEYSRKKGMSGKMQVPNFGYMVKYAKAEQPLEPIYEKESNIDLAKVIPNKTPLLKPKLDQPKGKLAGAPVSKEKGDWTEPGGGIKTKSRTVKPYNVKMGEYIGQNIKYAAQKATGQTPILRPGVTKTREALIQGKTGREANMAKAYFGAGYGNQPLSTVNESKAELQAKKKELRTDIRTGRKESPRDVLEYKKAELKDVKAGIKKAKLAGKYLDKYDRTYQGANQGSDKGAGIDIYTGRAMTGFQESKQNTYDPNANVKALKEKKLNEFMNFRSQLSNPTNKNTIANQEKSLSFKQNRQNAPSFSERRQQKKIDKELIRNANKKASQIGQ